MVDENASVADGLAARGTDAPDTVIVGTGTFGAIARAAGSATALAVVALITATRPR